MEKTNGSYCRVWSLGFVSSGGSTENLSPGILVAGKGSPIVTKLRRLKLTAA